MAKDTGTEVTLTWRELTLLISAAGIYAQEEKDLARMTSKFSEEAIQKMHDKASELLTLRAKLDEVKDRVYGLFYNVF